MVPFNALYFPALYGLYYLNKEVKLANNPVDQHVGQRLRNRRTILGITQQQLAQMLGITFQQVQKYKKGGNRMGCSRLYDVCQILDVDANYFFDDMTTEVKKRSPANTKGVEPQEVVPDLVPKSHLARRETIELVKAWYSLDDVIMRKRLIDLIRSVASLGKDLAA